MQAHGDLPPQVGEHVPRRVGGRQRRRNPQRDHSTGAAAAATEAQEATAARSTATNDDNGTIRLLVTRARLRFVLVPRVGAFSRLPVRAARVLQTRPGSHGKVPWGLCALPSAGQDTTQTYFSHAQYRSTRRPFSTICPSLLVNLQGRDVSTWQTDSQDFLEATHTQPTSHWASASWVPQCHTLMFLLPLRHLPRT